MSGTAETVRSHVLCCPDKFRGSVDAAAAARALAAGVGESGLDAVAHPLADGGEGTIDAVLAAGNGSVRRVDALDPLGRERRGARLGILPGRTVLVEMAEAGGLGLLEARERDVMAASTAGVGRLLRAALELDPRRIVVGLGGSATVDGGLGAIRELGARLLDAEGAELRGSGADLARLARIDPTGLPPGLMGRIEFAADVRSPLTGGIGAARVFGPQKGADPEQVELLDRGLGRLADILGLHPAERAVTGTAGGLAAPFVALAGARIASGPSTVQRLTGFEAVLEGAAACITGEGRIDCQSTLGKTVLGVARAAALQDVPVIAVAGSVDEHAEELYGEGVTAIVAINHQPGPDGAIMRRAEANLRRTGRAIGGLIGRLAEPRESLVAA